MNDTSDPFFEPYDRDDVAYGATPSAALKEYLRQIGGTGKALDLGAGAGRDTIVLANAGFQVTAVDLSDRGSQRIVERAQSAGVAELVQTAVGDVRAVDMPPRSYAAIVATTVLDHLPAADALALWRANHRLR